MLRGFVAVVALTGLLLAPARVAGQPTQKLFSQNKSGTITANGGSVEFLNTGGLGSLKVQSTGTYTGTWELQCSVAPTGETPVYDTDDELNLSLEGSTTTVQSVTDSVGIWTATIAGCTAVKAIATSAMTGTLTVYMYATTTGGGASGGGGGTTFDGVLKDASGGDSVMDTANDAVRVNIIAGAGSGGTAAADESAFTLATTSVTPMGCIEATDTAAAGSVMAVRCGSNRVLDVDVISMPTTTVTATNLDVQIGGSDTLTVGTVSTVTNLSQLGGTAITMNAGNAAAGTQRVVLASDQAQFGGAAAAMADDTANPTVGKIAAYMMCFDGTTWDRCQTTRDPCDGAAKTVLPINISTATTTEITPSLAGASTHYYVCSFSIWPTAGAQNIAVVDDDTDNCASVTSGMAGGTTAGTGGNFAANGGIVLGNGGSTVMKTNGTNRVICLVTSAAVQTSGVMTVVAAP